MPPLARIQTRSVKTGATYTLGYASDERNATELVATYQEIIDPARKRKIVESVMVDAPTPNPSVC